MGDLTDTFVPPVDPDRTPLPAPIARVLVLEDRARIERHAPVTCAPGTTRLVVHGVSPLAQDVSVRAAVTDGPARVVDARIRRAVRIRRADKPEEIAELDAAIERLGASLAAADDDRAAVEERRERVLALLGRALAEIPEDVAWGRSDPAGWKAAVDGLCEKARALADRALESWFAESDTARELGALLLRRAVADRPDQHLAAWIEVDLALPAGATAAEAAVSVFYTVPCALWRPSHQARLAGGQLELRCRAAIWQRTGEDWDDVELRVSTARSSLGVSPPLLADDVLEVEKRTDDVVIAARQVAVRTTGTAGTPPAVVDLPGVDDGGEVRNLLAPRRVTIRSDGRPAFVELFRFAAPATVERIATPELVEAVIRRVTSVHTGTLPVLAGPVELVVDGGPIGVTEISFVAPTQPFELGFGPEPELRVVRSVRETTDDKDKVDKWRRRVTKVDLFLSNLGDRAHPIVVTERVPISETEYVRVKRLDDRITGTPVIDEDGMVVWTLTLPPYGTTTLKLGWEVAMAPDVKGGLF